MTTSTDMFNANLFKLFLGLLILFSTHSDGSPTHEKKNYAPSKSKLIKEVTQHDLEIAVNVALEHVQKLATFERNIHVSGLRTDNSSPFYAQMIDFLASEEAINNSRNAFVAIKASQYLLSKFCTHSLIKNKQCVDHLSMIKLPGSSLGEICAAVYEVHCNTESKYRTIDGSCNNLKNPVLGKSFTPYRRLLKPNYDDEINSIHTVSVIGKELASPRLISTYVAQANHVTQEGATQAVAVWGLFIGHDMYNSPASNMVNMKTPITCCTNDGRPLLPRHNHVSCAAISIPHNDVFYSKYFQSCMNYVRTLPAIRPDCTFGPSEQINQVSHFLDGSTIYGSSKWKTNSLRAMWGGRLLTSLEKTGEEYPPILNISETECHITNLTRCYKTGDYRVNSQPQLRVLHTLFIREHNRIANQLAFLNEHWDDERLFQESRKIVIGEIQHITYHEWLPLFIGKKHSEKISNVPYDETVNPSTSNSFATAALPVVYSMIDGNIGLYSETRNVTDAAHMKEHFVKNSISKMKVEFLDNVVRGLATQQCLKADISFSDVVTNYWYSQSGEYGMDLLSLDIQRGRDHGLQSYVNYRKYCKLSVVTEFEDLQGIVNQDTIARMEKVYKKVDDIDLLVGALSEFPAEGAMVGPTLQCIIGEQFLKTRSGDKFFYDNRPENSKFTEEQMKQIQRTSLSRIFCDNSNRVKRMQKDVFTPPHTQFNRLLSCSETAIPFVDLKVWKHVEDLASEKA